MHADEIASFRALLQAQAAPAKTQPRSWLQLGRRRDDPFAPAALVERPPPASIAAPEPLTLERVVLDWSAPAADPPPSRPPRFGRRDEAVPAAEDGEPADPEQALGELRRRAVMLFAPAPAWDDVHSTPDLPVEREAPGTGPAPGVIAGWSRVRPPSAQRRILARLEAVFMVEQQGLDARRAAVAA